MWIILSAASPPKDALNRATKLSQLVSYFSISVSLSASDSSFSGPPAAYASSSSAFAYSFLASSIHPLRRSACIPGGTLVRLFCSLQTAKYILSYVSTESYTWDSLTDRGIFFPGGCMWQDRSTQHVVIHSRVNQ